MKMLKNVLFLFTSLLLLKTLAQTKSDYKSGMLLEQDTGEITNLITGRKKEMIAVVSDDVNLDSPLTGFIIILLLIFHEPFGFMPFFGVISLAGIVINNAIVLIDRIKIEENKLKRPIQDTIIAACLQRFSPILLAAFTTVLGLVPLYLSGGEMCQGMTVSIMVGLLFGTVITLLFFPSVYSILYRVYYKDYQFNNELLKD